MARATDLPENTRRLLAERTAPKPVIYDPKLDGADQIRAAVAQAKRTGKHVMVQIGGQWCIWCIRLHQTITADAELQRLQDESYVVVHLNYSPENKNEPTLAALGYPQRFGFPVLVILDASGQRLHTQDSAFLEDGDFHSKAKLVKFFGQWSPKALDPATYAKKP
jgi:thiol:disulfide interchange protein